MLQFDRKIETSLEEMITIPGDSTLVHDRDLACDWIELSSWREDNPISQLNVYDCLEEEYLLEEQTSTSQTKERLQSVVDNCWIELEQRSKRFSSAYPFQVGPGTLEPIEGEHPFRDAYAFFLVLSLARHCTSWHQPNSGYSEQGSLFELIVEEACWRLFPTWRCWRSGWGADNPSSWRGVVDEVCTLLKAKRNDDFEIWDTPGAKERGLDILLFREFSDGRPSSPCFLIQCGSGKHWPDKLTEPELNIWNSAVNFYCQPNKAFCCPYFLETRSFKQAAERVKPGFILDRERILLSFHEDAHLNNGTCERLAAWLEEKARIVC